MIDDLRLHQASKILFALGALGLILILAAGGLFGGSVNSATTNFETPFGLSWNQIDIPGKKLKPFADRICMERVKKLPELIPRNHEQKILDLCTKEQFQRHLADDDLLPNTFKGGELIVTVRNGTPLIYHFSLGHDGSGNPARLADSIHRRILTKSIKTSLVSLYGEPSVTGYLYYIPPYFMPGREIPGTCSLWVDKTVGAIFCSEGVVSLGRIYNSLSLSFIKLDRVPYGDALNCMSEHYGSARCLYEYEQQLLKYPRESTYYLEVLDRWMPDSSERCQYDNLKPIQSLLTLSPKAEEELADRLNRYSAAHLLNHVGVDRILPELSVAERQNARLILQKHAALQGDANAAFRIGHKLLHCEGVQQDLVKGRTWLVKAADSGYAPALKDLASLYALGFGEESPSLSKAIDLLTECAEIDLDTCKYELRALNRLIQLTQ